MYYDSDLQNKVTQPISFGPVLAGSKTSKFIYIENTINYPINFTFSLDNDNKSIKLGKTFKSLKPEEMGIIELILSPKLTLMHPVEATLVTNISYLVE